MALDTPPVFLHPPGFIISCLFTYFENFKTCIDGLDETVHSRHF